MSKQEELKNIFDIGKLSKDLREVRGNSTLSNVSKLSNISITILHRIEKGHVPDLLNYYKVCMFLNKDINNYFKK